MANQFPHFKFGFRNNPSDDDVDIYDGARKKPGSVSVKKSDEFIVAADGTGDFLTIQEALDELGVSSGAIRVKAGDYLITTGLTLEANQALISSGY